MIYVTHDQVEAMGMADRIAVMSEGVLQQYDPPDVIYNRPNNTFVARFVGSVLINMVAAQYNGGGTVTALAEGSRPVPLAEGQDAGLRARSTATA